MISNKKKKLFFISAWALSIIICAGLALFNPLKNNIEEKQAQTQQIEGYVIGVYDEKIAVFAQGDAVPIETFDVYITTLPESDQKSLKKGIKVKSKTELRRLIEDYTS